MVYKLILQSVITEINAFLHTSKNNWHFNYSVAYEKYYYYHTTLHFLLLIKSFFWCPSSSNAKALQTIVRVKMTKQNEKNHLE